MCSGDRPSSWIEAGFLIRPAFFYFLASFQHVHSASFLWVGFSIRITHSEFRHRMIYSIEKIHPVG
jgi:hypothetical protein